MRHAINDNSSQTKEKTGDERAKTAILVLLLLVFVSVPVLSYQFFWYVPSSAGGKLNSANYAGGVTLGQTSIGDVITDDSLFSGNYGFWYSDIVPYICVNLSNNRWIIDTIGVSTVRSMHPGEVIKASSSGNCSVGFGMEFISSLFLPWTAGTSPDLEVFVLYSQFTADSVMPLIYHPESDLVTDSLRWSDAIVYGSDGYNVGCGDISYLWFKFLSPTSSDYYNEFNILVIRIYARPNLP